MTGSGGVGEADTGSTVEEMGRNSCWLGVEGVRVQEQKHQAPSPGSGSGLFHKPEGDMVGLNDIRAHIILSIISFLLLSSQSQSHLPLLYSS